MCWELALGLKHLEKLVAQTALDASCADGADDCISANVDVEDKSIGC